MRRSRTLAILALSTGALACQKPRDDQPAHRGTATAAPLAPSLMLASAAPGPGAELAPRPLPGFFEALTVPGHPDAWLSLPTGATGKRPVLVVIHGAGDRPDWQCGGWRHATEEYPFVLCPRGFVDHASSTRDDIRYTHIGGAPLLEYIDASLQALAARYPGYVDTSAPLYAGFSLGAAEIVALAVQAPSRFARIALIEGGTNGWSRARIEAFINRGGVRVLFGCGQEGVYDAALSASKRLAAEGVDTRVVYAKVGHTFDPPLEDAVRQELAWWVDGAAGWPVEQFEP